MERYHFGFLSGFQSDTVQDETAKNLNDVPYDCVPLNVLVVVTVSLPSDESNRELSWRWCF